MTENSTTTDVIKKWRSDILNNCSRVTNTPSDNTTATDFFKQCRNNIFDKCGRIIDTPSHKIKPFAIQTIRNDIAPNMSYTSNKPYDFSNTTSDKLSVKRLYFIYIKQGPCENYCCKFYSIDEVITFFKKIMPHFKNDAFFKEIDDNNSFPCDMSKYGKKSPEYGDHNINPLNFLCGVNEELGDDYDDYDENVNRYSIAIIDLPNQNKYRVVPAKGCLCFEDPFYVIEL
jgi:hypothetical protein